MTPLVRRGIVALVVVVAVLVGYVALSVVQVWRAARIDGARPADAIIVLGAAQYDGRPSPVFAARLDHARALYAEGIAPRIVVTGGGQPGDRFTEAAVGADYLAERGVPADAILRETTSRNSWESLRAAARFLFPAGVRRVVLVSDPFHSLRARLTAEEIGFDATTSPTRASPIRGVAEWRRFGGEGLRVAVGRLFGFGRATRLQERRDAAVPTGPVRGSRDRGPGSRSPSMRPESRERLSSQDLSGVV